MRPTIGIIGNSTLLNNESPAHATETMYSDAISGVSDCMPLVIPTDPRLLSINELLAHFDGFLFTGCGPNVHPNEYGEEATEAHGEFDTARDAMTLPLIQACVERGQPFLGICRGFQEVNVAMGGTLYPEVHKLPGRTDHRAPSEGSLDEKFALRHLVELSEGGAFHKLLATTEVMTNSLHSQGIKTPGPRIVVEGRTPDGSLEAICVKDAPGFTLSVQWHPEYRAGIDPASRSLFSAFGNSARAWANKQ